MFQNKVNIFILLKGFSIFHSQMELATNKYPYEKWPTPFQQLKQVVQEPSPTLPDSYSTEIREFLDLWYVKHPVESINFAIYMYFHFGVLSVLLWF